MNEREDEERYADESDQNSDLREEDNMVKRLKRRKTRGKRRQASVSVREAQKNWKEKVQIASSKPVVVDDEVISVKSSNSASSPPKDVSTELTGDDAIENAENASPQHVYGKERDVEKRKTDAYSDLHKKRIKRRRRKTRGKGRQASVRVPAAQDIPEKSPQSDSSPPKDVPTHLSEDDAIQNVETATPQREDEEASLNSVISAPPQDQIKTPEALAQGQDNQETDGMNESTMKGSPHDDSSSLKIISVESLNVQLVQSLPTYERDIEGGGDTTGSTFKESPRDEQTTQEENPVGIQGMIEDPSHEDLSIQENVSGDVPTVQATQDRESCSPRSDTGDAEHEESVSEYSLATFPYSVSESSCRLYPTSPEFIPKVVSEKQGTNRSSRGAQVEMSGGEEIRNTVTPSPQRKSSSSRASPEAGVSFQDELSAAISEESSEAHGDSSNRTMQSGMDEGEITGPLDEVPSPNDSLALNETTQSSKDQDTSTSSEAQREIALLSLIYSPMDESNVPEEGLPLLEGDLGLQIPNESDDDFTLQDIADIQSEIGENFGTGSTSGTIPVASGSKKKRREPGQKDKLSFKRCTSLVKAEADSSTTLYPHNIWGSPEPWGSDEGVDNESMAGECSLIATRRTDTEMGNAFAIFERDDDSSSPSSELFDASLEEMVSRLVSTPPPIPVPSGIIHPDSPIDPESPLWFPRTIQIGCWVAVKLEDDWYPGLVEEVNFPMIEVMLMERVVAGRHVFRWPQLPFRRQVHQSSLLSILNSAPIPVADECMTIDDYPYLDSINENP